MNTNNKAIAIVLGAVAALFAVSLLVRFIVLSQYGFAGPWIWFALPAGGIGLVVLLLRLGLLNFGQNSGGTVQAWQHNIGAQAPPVAPPYAPPPPAAPASQRLQQLDSMRSNGAISESEYNSQREQIISTL
jgi:hypothetical protein